MAVYEITAPNGKIYEVTAPDSASQEEVLRYAQQNYGTIGGDKPQNLNATFQQGLNAVGANTGYIGNVLKGASARGQEAMTSLNPFATQAEQDRIARQQEWVKQTPGAGIGEVVSDIAMTAPAQAYGGPAGRVLLTGLTEGLTRPGNAKERAVNTAAGIAGAGLGEAGGGLVSFALQPFKNVASSTVKRLTDLAKKYDIPLSAADITQNPSAQYMESALQALPTSSSYVTKQKIAKRGAWQAALLAEAGASGRPTQATPEVMGALKAELDDAYKYFSSRNNLRVDERLLNALNSIRKEYLRKLPVNQRKVVSNYIDDLAVGGRSVDVIGRTKTRVIPGDVYQNTRSLLDKQARGLEASDPTTALALKDIRNSIDQAFLRGASPDDARLIQETNRRWMVMRSIEDSLDPVTGDVSPNKFMNLMKKRYKNSTLYGRGPQELSDLAKIGKTFVSEQTRDSGTPQRSFWMDVLSHGTPGNVGLMGGLLAGSMGDPTMAMSAAALSGLTSLAVPPIVARAAWNPGGYLAKGATDLTQEVLPGITRDALLNIMTRGGGTFGGVEAYKALNQ